MSIGERIRQLRDKESRAKFAERIGVHPQTLYLYETDKRAMDVDLLRKYCQEFDVSAEWLIFGNEGLQAIVEKPIEEPINVSTQQYRTPSEKELQLAEENDNLKNQLMAAQSEALKAYEIALSTIRAELFKQTSNIPHKDIDSNAEK